MHAMCNQDHQEVTAPVPVAMAEVTVPVPVAMAEVTVRAPHLQPTWPGIQQSGQYGQM